MFKLWRPKHSDQQLYISCAVGPDGRHYGLAVTVAQHEAAATERLRNHVDGIIEYAEEGKLSVIQPIDNYTEELKKYLLDIRYNVPATIVEVSEDAWIHLGVVAGAEGGAVPDSAKRARSTWT